MNVTFAQMARCFAAYRDLDSAFWPFVHYVATNDEVHNDPVASAEAMRRMLAITMADVYAMVQTEDLSDPIEWDQMNSFRQEFLSAADVVLEADASDTAQPVQVAL